MSGKAPVDSPTSIISMASGIIFFNDPATPEIYPLSLHDALPILGADLATPAADHTLEPIRMEPSKGTLSVSSVWPGGELFLSGQSRGPLPAAKVSVCSGAYDLQVRFPAGGFSQHIAVEDGKSLSVE